MKLWIIAALLLTLTTGASAAPLTFPPGAEAAETRISDEVSPLLRAWARSEASYSTHVSQVGRDLKRLFPQVQPGAETDAVIFLVLMEMARVQHAAGASPADADHDPMSALREILKRLDASQDAIIKQLKN